MSDLPPPTGHPLNRKQRRAALQTGAKTDAGTTTPNPSSRSAARRKARGVALEVLRRIESGGAYANLVLGPTLAASTLSEQDRRFATELVYGSTRMRRACDAIVDRFVSQSLLTMQTRSILRLGAYQLAYAGVPAHAAVSADRGPRAGQDPRLRQRCPASRCRRAEHRRYGLALGRGAAQLPRVARRPRWQTDLGDDASPALERMNQPLRPVTECVPDGYVQDFDRRSGFRRLPSTLKPRRANVYSTCAQRRAARPLPWPDRRCARRRGRHASRAAGCSSYSRERRASSTSTSRSSPPTGLRPPFRSAPLSTRCSSMPRARVLARCGVVPDARWRIEPKRRLASSRALQAWLAGCGGLAGASPGGRLVYSVCTLLNGRGVGRSCRRPAGFEVDHAADPAVGSVAASSGTVGGSCRTMPTRTEWS